MTSRGRNTGATLGILAAITVIAAAAILAVTQLRSPSLDATPTTLPEPTPTTTDNPLPTAPTTTTTTLFLLPNETGEPFTWEGTLEIDGQVPLALVEHEGIVYLFTGTPASQQFHPPTGMQVWATDDGTDWAPRQVIEDDYVVFSVISTRFGIIASGYEQESGDGLVWRSVDGTTWAPTIVAPGGGPSHKRALSFAVSNDDLIYILADGYVQTDRRPTIDALSEHFGGEVTDFGMVIEGDRFELAVLGPFGVRIAMVTPEEIGLTRSDLDPPFGESPTTAWVSRDGSTWEQRTVNDPPRWGFVGPDGRILAQTRASTGVGSTVTSSLSPDSLTWAEVDRPALGEVRHRWSGGFLGQGVIDQVAISDNGLSWRNLSPVLLLNRQYQWSFSAMGGGDRGIAIVGTAFSDRPPASSEPIEWSQDGYTIIAEDHAFVVISDDVELVRVPRWGGEFDDDLPVRWDPAASTLTFLDPDTNQDLVTIDVAETAQRLPGRGEQPHFIGAELAGQALLFSHSETWPTPGVVTSDHGLDVWTVQSLSRIVPGRASHLLVRPDRVILVTEVADRTGVFVGLIPESP